MTLLLNTLRRAIFVTLLSGTLAPVSLFAKGEKQYHQSNHNGSNRSAPSMNRMSSPKSANSSMHRSTNKPVLQSQLPMKHAQTKPLQTKQSQFPMKTGAKTFSSLNGNSGITGKGFPTHQQSQASAFPNGNTGITGKGLGGKVPPAGDPTRTTPRQPRLDRQALHDKFKTAQTGTFDKSKIQSLSIGPGKSAPPIEPPTGKTTSGGGLQIDTSKKSPVQLPTTGNTNTTPATDVGGVVTGKKLPGSTGSRIGDPWTTGNGHSGPVTTTPTPTTPPVPNIPPVATTPPVPTTPPMPNTPPAPPTGGNGNGGHHNHGGLGRAVRIGTMIGAMVANGQGGYGGYAGGYQAAPAAPVAYNEPEPAYQAPLAAGSVDLVLEDAKLFQPATAVAGPAYAVRFRNQGLVASPGFLVAAVTSADGSYREDAPKAVLEVPGLAAGEVRDVVLRLPRTDFNYLILMLDANGTVSEPDKTNNSAVVERAAL